MKQFSILSFTLLSILVLQQLTYAQDDTSKTTNDAEMDNQLLELEEMRDEVLPIPPLNFDYEKWVKRQIALNGNSPQAQLHRDRIESIFLPRAWGNTWKEGPLYSRWSIPDASETIWKFIKERDRQLRQQAANCPLGVNWTELGLRKIATSTTTKHGYGRINAIRFHPTADTVYICSPGGGIWKRSLTNAADQWQPINDTNLSYSGSSGTDISCLGVTDMIIKPDSLHIMYATSGNNDMADEPEYTLNPLSIGILRSTDYGKNWTPCLLDTSNILPQENNTNIYKLVMQKHNSQRIVAISNKGFYTTNDGQNFKRIPIPSGNNLSDIVFHPNDTSVLYAVAKNGGMYKSSTGGHSFLPSSPLPSLNIYNVKLAVIPNATGAAAKIIYAVASKEGQGCLEGIYLSKDAGNSFQKIYGAINSHNNILGYETVLHDTLRTNSIGLGSYALALTVDPDTATTIYVGSVNTWKLRIDTSGVGSVVGNPIFISNKDATDKKYIHADIHDLKFYNGKLYVASDGGIYKDTTNSLNIFAWKDLGRGLGIRQSLTVDARGNQLIDGAQDNYFSMLTNATNKEWKLIFSGDGCNTVWKDNTTAYIATQYNDIYRYNTVNNSIQKVIYSTQKASATPTAFGVNQDVRFAGKTIAYQNDTLYVGYESVWKSTNLSASPPTFVNIGPNPSQLVSSYYAYTPENSKLNVVKVAPSNNQIVYATKGESIGYTLSGGGTWHSIFYSITTPTATEGLIDTTFFKSNLPANFVTDIAIHPTNPYLIWVTYSGYSNNKKVFQMERQVPSGKWTVKNLSLNLPNLPTNAIVCHTANNKNHLYIGTDVGIYYTHNCTAPGDTMKWLLYNDTINTLPNVAISDLSISNNQLVAATYGRGIWKSPLADTTNNCTCQSSFNHAPYFTDYNTDPKVFCIEDLQNNDGHFSLGTVSAADAEGDFFAISTQSSNLPIYFSTVYLQGSGTVDLDMTFVGDNISDFVGTHYISVYLLDDFLYLVKQIEIPVVITCGENNEFGAGCGACPIPVCFNDAGVGLEIGSSYVGCDTNMVQKGYVAAGSPNTTCVGNVQVKLSASNSNVNYAPLSPPENVLYLEAGNYNIDIYINGMSHSYNIPITIPSENVLNHLWVQNVVKIGSPAGSSTGSLSFASGGGSGRYLYRLYNSSNVLVYEGETEQITNLAADTYQFQMIDQVYGCVYGATVTIPITNPIACSCTGSIVSVIPNPSSSNFTITARLTASGDCLAGTTSPAKLTFHNAQGTLINTLYDGQLLLDQNHTLNYSGANLPSGIYYLKLKACGKPPVSFQLVKN
ncbi:MAG: hypothetical protein JNM36_12945 [Chitinophagales bacterium]|nr:hypothetical protein [Chitinophagales bacterium]